MTIKIKIDPGHGGKDSGAVANGLQEKDVVLTIAKKTAVYLNNNYSKVQATLTRSTDIFHELSKRADIANKDGADYFISIHLNSFNADSHGFETYRQPGKGPATAAFQTAVHEEILSFLQPFGIQDRQKKEKNLAVLRETNMPAVLIENLFVTNPKEAALLKNDTFLDGLAKAHAEGIAKGAKLVRKESPGTYRIYTGTFKDEASAQKAAKAIGYNAFVRNQRVWTGVFTSLESAEKAKVEIAKNHGFNPQIRKEE